MAVDMRARYFGEFDEGAMPPTFGVFPQYELPNNNFMVMPPAAAPYAEQQYLPAVQPMTQEAAPFDLSSLAGLDLSGLGGFGGGRMGGVIQDPNIQYIGAPVSNKGNPTGRMGGNVFAVTPDQPVRLVDLNTKTVVFEGTGFDAARKATELGQNLTDTMGRKASYDIQTADPSGAYVTVANEKRNKSTLGSIADVAGTALPIITAIATGGMSLPAQMALAAGAGGLGAALKGDNILKGALLGGATAGVVGGTGLDKAIGGALGSLGKGAVTAGGKAAADATGDIVVTALSKALQGAGGALGQEVLSQAGKAGLSEVTGYKTPAEQYAQQPTPTTLQPPVDMYAGLDPIDVLARTSGSGSPFGAAFPIPVNAMLSGSLNPTQPAQQPKTAEDIEAERNPMVVTANKPYLSPEALAAIMATFGGGALAAAQPTLTQQAKTAEDIEAEKNPITVTGGGLESLTPDELLAFLGGAPTNLLPDNFFDPASTDVNKKLTAKEIADYLRLAGLAVGVVGGGGGGGGGGGTPGSQAINPIFSAKLPTPGVGGAFKVGGLDYTTPPATDAYRYAMGPAMDIRAGTDLSKATSPYAGYGPGTLGEETFKRVTGMSHGGAMGYARGSSRDSFAVDGPGTGRSDDIPAVLSDGEYVIDAETVALLGDGSSKAGAKKLDEMRVKVRKHKGRNLAKGKFSVNAKRPEKYLSGGRT
jgi:hypothetical protein